MSCPSPCPGCSKRRILLTPDGADVTVLAIATVALVAFPVTGHDGLREAALLLGGGLVLRGLIRLKEHGCYFVGLHGARSMLYGELFVAVSVLLDGAIAALRAAAIP